MSLCVCTYALPLIIFIYYSNMPPCPRVLLFKKLLCLMSVPPQYPPHVSESMLFSLYIPLTVSLGVFFMVFPFLVVFIFTFPIEEDFDACKRVVVVLYPSGDTSLQKMKRVEETVCLRLRYSSQRSLRTKF